MHGAVWLLRPGRETGRIQRTRRHLPRRAMRMPTYFILFAFLNFAAGPYAPIDTPSADKIIAKSLAIYDAVASYQGTLTVATEMGIARETLSFKMKIINGSDHEIVRSAGEMTRTRTKGGVSSSTVEKQVDDGTTVFTARMDMKQWSQRPHARERVSSLFKGALGDMAASKPPLSVTVIQQRGR